MQKKLEIYMRVSMRNFEFIVAVMRPSVLIKEMAVWCLSAVLPSSSKGSAADTAAATKAEIDSSVLKAELLSQNLTAIPMADRWKYSSIYIVLWLLRIPLENKRLNSIQEGSEQKTSTHIEEHATFIAHIVMMYEE